MKREHGLSLVELMISIALGLIVLLAATVIFTNTSGSRNEMEKSNRQTESGRYASQLLTDNLRMAGYMAEFDPTPLTLPTSLPDPCATTTSMADLVNAMPLHVQGVDNVSSTSKPSCISDVKSDTDILVIRRASSCVEGSAGCAAFEAGAPHLQASLCTPTTGGTELAYTIPTSNSDYATHYFKLKTTRGDLTLHKNDCTTLADIYRYRVDIYFIANNNESGDGIPTLKRASLGPAGFATTPLVDGIESMHLEYGIDTNNDGSPDKSTPAPADPAEWRNVMSARVHLLVRNTEASAGHTDSRSYVLGTKADGSVNTVGPFNDRYKRHVYAATTHLVNPARRRQ